MTTPESPTPVEMSSSTIEHAAELVNFIGKSVVGPLIIGAVGTGIALREGAALLTGNISPSFALIVGGIEAVIIGGIVIARTIYDRRNSVTNEQPENFVEDAIDNN
jgi:hypothetical protein